MKPPAGGRPRCRDCPFYEIGGRCHDQSKKSGRCGDYVWYWRNGKQRRRRHAYPYDPRTPAQLRCREYLSAASRKYSRLLTDEEQEICLRKGAKMRSRRRLGQSGTLTGHQYWVHKQYPRERAKSNPTKPITSSQVAGAHNLTGSTSGTHRPLSSVSPHPQAKAAGQTRPRRRIRKPMQPLNLAKHRALPRQTPKRRQRTAGRPPRRVPTRR
jgi:hypothetical protein